MSIEQPTTFYRLRSPPPLGRDLTLTVFTHESISLITGESPNRNLFYANVGKNGIETALLMAIAKNSTDGKINSDISVRSHIFLPSNNSLTSSKTKVATILSDEQIKAWVRRFRFHESLICPKEMKGEIVQNAEVRL